MSIYGLRIYDSAGNLTVNYTDRLNRYHSHGSVTVGYNSYVDVTVSGMVNNDSWDVSISFSPVLWLSVEASYLKMTNKLRIYYDAPVNLGFAGSPSSLTISYIILRN
jgi:hypothetical protein